LSNPKEPRFTPVASADVPWDAFGHGEKFGGRAKHLTAAATSHILGERKWHVGVALEELPPGKQSCPFHFHMLEEEHLYVLEGECTLRLGEERLAFKAGDYAIFPAGEKTGHCLINETDKVCRYVVIGENNPNESCVYPDSNKVSNRWLGERYDRSAQREYWDGEE
jgi:uncharacterized cupin superfamily protein